MEYAIFVAAEKDSNTFEICTTLKKKHFTKIIFQTKFILKYPHFLKK